MNSEEFVAAIKEFVRDSAIDDTIENLEDPPGRKVPEAEKQRSKWFNNLPDEDHNNIKSIVTDAVDEALFGLLAVLDGSRAIEDGDDKGRLLLVHKGLTEELLNDPNKIGLHDLYNAKD